MKVEDKASSSLHVTTGVHSPSLPLQKNEGKKNGQKNDQKERNENKALPGFPYSQYGVLLKNNSSCAEQFL
jgi:hypothetical protein